MKELEAGPDLDALVHTRVMGFPRTGKHGHQWAHVAPYSTDLDVAQRIVKHMRESGFPPSRPQRLTRGRFASRPR